MPSQQLALISRAKAELEEARTIPEVLDVRDKAEAVRKYLRARGESVHAQNTAAMLAIECEAKAGRLLAEMEKTGERERRGGDRRSKSRNVTLNDLGVTKTRSSRCQLIAAVPEKEREAYYAEQQKREEPIVQAGLLKLAKTLKRHDRVERRKKPLPRTGELWDLRVGDFVEALSDVPDGSVDAIVTDPPYGREFLGEYRKLVELAERVLVPGGHLVVMVGQAHLPRVLELMRSDAVTYQWTLCYFTPGSSTQVWARRVKSNWKPVLWYTRGKTTEEHVVDVVWNRKEDRRFHEWGQAVDGIALLIERFSVEGETIVDPFLGGGSTAVAATRLKRRFIGCDVEASCVETTAERLNGLDDQSRAAIHEGQRSAT